MNRPTHGYREIAIAIGLLWLTLCAILFFFGGLRPKTGAGWVLFVVFGPPLYALLEIAGESTVERVDNAPGLRTVRRRVESRTAHIRFSWLRVGYLLLRTLLLLTCVALVVVAVMYFAGDALQPLGDFLREHFEGV